MHLYHLYRWLGLPEPNATHWWLKTTELDCLRSGGGEPRMLAPLLPAESSEGVCPMPVASLEWFASSLWHPQTYRSFTSISASHRVLPVDMSVCQFPFVIRTPVRLEPSLPEYTSCLLTSATTLFPRLHSEVCMWGVGGGGGKDFSTEILGEDTIQPIAPSV